MTKNINWKQLLPALMLPLALGGLSAWLNRGAMADYAVLNRPPLSPPGWRAAEVGRPPCRERG